MGPGIADPECIAIFGYFYGGLAAAAAVVRHDSHYTCAIYGAPVTVLTRLGNLWSMDPMENTDKTNIPVRFRRIVALTPALFVIVERPAFAGRLAFRPSPCPRPAPRPAR